MEPKLIDYSHITADLLPQLHSLAKNLIGKKIVHVNATSLGGGVAEMLHSIIPLQKDLGLDSHWHVIPPNDAFFEVTKSIHNFLQGKEGDLTNEQKQTYLNHNKTIAQGLDDLNADILIIHDPQPAAAISFMKKRPQAVIWRCHIDTSTPNKNVWAFLSPYLKLYDQLIFTTEDFVHSDIPSEKVTFMTPVIDPFAPKNKLMSKSKAREILRSLGVDTAKPLVTQVSRLDPWKDPKGVIDAFELAQKQIPQLQLAFVAQMASDDPEGVKISKQTQEYAKGKAGISFFVNLENNDEAVNAFQTASDVILQKSIREGFALTVTEALWKKAIVIGGKVGGIKLQIEDGINGYLVESAEQAAAKIVYAIKNPKQMKQIREKAHETVKSKFLMPHLLYNELALFAKLI